MNSLTAVQENKARLTEPARKHNFTQVDNDMDKMIRSIATDSEHRREVCKKHGSQEDNVNKPAKRRTPLLGRLRRNFEHHVKSKDESSKRSQKPQNKRFRIKLQDDRMIQRSKSYNGPFWKKKSHKEKLSRSKSYGGREPSSRFQKHTDLGDGQTVKQTVQAALGTLHCNESKPKEVSTKNKDVANKGVHESDKCGELKERESCVSLYHIIQHSQLIAVKLQRAPKEMWGIKLIHIDKESSTSENGAKLNEVITVDRAKKPAVNPIAVQRDASASPSTSHHTHLVAEFREVSRRSIKMKNNGIKASLSSVVKEENYQPRRGVRILGLTEEGVAAKDGKLAVEDLIIEVNGRIVLDSSPEQVVTAIEKSLTVDMVVSRAMHPRQKENCTGDSHCNY